MPPRMGMARRRSAQPAHGPNEKPLHFHGIQDVASTSTTPTATSLETAPSLDPNLLEPVATAQSHSAESNEQLPTPAEGKAPSSRARRRQQAVTFGENVVASPGMTTATPPMTPLLTNKGTQPAEHQQGQQHRQGVFIGGKSRTEIALEARKEVKKDFVGDEEGGGGQMREVRRKSSFSEAFPSLSKTMQRQRQNQTNLMLSTSGGKGDALPGSPAKGGASTSNNNARRPSAFQRVRRKSSSATRPTKIETDFKAFDDAGSPSLQSPLSSPGGSIRSPGGSIAGLEEGETFSPTRPQMKRQSSTTRKGFRAKWQAFTDSDSTDVGDEDKDPQLERLSSTTAMIGARIPSQVASSAFGPQVSEEGPHSPPLSRSGSLRRKDSGLNSSVDSPNSSKPPSRTGSSTTLMRRQSSSAFDAALSRHDSLKRSSAFKEAMLQERLAKRSNSAKGNPFAIDKGTGIGYFKGVAATNSAGPAFVLSDQHQPDGFSGDRRDTQQTTSRSRSQSEGAEQADIGITFTQPTVGDFGELDSNSRETSQVPRTTSPSTPGRRVTVQLPPALRSRRSSSVFGPDGSGADGAVNMDLSVRSASVLPSLEGSRLRWSIANEEAAMYGAGNTVECRRASTRAFAKDTRTHSVFFGTGAHDLMVPTANAQQDPKSNCPEEQRRHSRSAVTSFGSSSFAGPTGHRPRLSYARLHEYQDAVAEMESSSMSAAQTGSNISASLRLAMSGAHSTVASHSAVESSEVMHGSNTNSSGSAPQVNWSNIVKKESENRGMAPMFTRQRRKGIVIHKKEDLSVERSVSKERVRLDENGNLIDYIPAGLDDDIREGGTHVIGGSRSQRILNDPNASPEEHMLHAAAMVQVPLEFVVRQLEQRIIEHEVVHDVFLYVPFLVMFTLYFLLGRNIEQNHFVAAGVRDSDIDSGQLYTDFQRTQMEEILRGAPLYYFNNSVPRNISSGDTTRTGIELPSNFTGLRGDIDQVTRDAPLRYEPPFLKITTRVQWLRWFREIFTRTTYDCDNPDYHRLETSIRKGSTPLLGAARLRVLRVKENSCAFNDKMVPESYNSSAGIPWQTRCYSEFNEEEVDKDGFCKQQNPAFPREELFNFFDCGSVTLTNRGEHRSYPCQGFVATLPFNASCREVDAFTELITPRDPKDHRESRSIDGALDNIQSRVMNRSHCDSYVFHDSTRMIMLEYFLYSLATDAFVRVKAIVEMVPGGAMIPNYTTRVFTVWTTALLARTVFEFIFFAFVLYFFRKMFIDWALSVRKTGKLTAFLFDLWNVMELTNLISLVVSLALRWTWWAKSSQVRVKFLTESVYPQELEEVEYFYTIQVHVNAVCVVITYLKVLKYLRLNDRLNVLTRTLELCKSDLLALLVLFVFLHTGFSFAGMLIYGAQIERFKNLNTAFSTLMFAILGQFDYDLMRMKHFYLTPIFFWTYIFIGWMLFLNFFIVVLSEGFAQVNRSTTLLPLDVVVLRQIDELRLWFRWPYLREWLYSKTIARSRISLMIDMMHFLNEHLKLTQIAVEDMHGAFREDTYMTFRDLQWWLPSTVTEDLGETYLLTMWEDIVYEYIHKEKASHAFVHHEQLRRMVSGVTNEYLKNALPDFVTLELQAESLEVKLDRVPKMLCLAGDRKKLRKTQAAALKRLSVDLERRTSQPFADTPPGSSRTTTPELVAAAPPTKRRGSSFVPEYKPTARRKSRLSINLGEDAGPLVPDGSSGVMSDDGDDGDQYAKQRNRRISSTSSTGSALHGNNNSRGGGNRFQRSRGMARQRRGSTDSNSSATSSAASSGGFQGYTFQMMLDQRADLLGNPQDFATPRNRSEPNVPQQVVNVAATTDLMNTSFEDSAPLSLGTRLPRYDEPEENSLEGEAEEDGLEDAIRGFQFDA